MFLFKYSKNNNIRSIINKVNNCNSKQQPQQYYTTSNREKGSVEREWWKPNINLSDALEKSKSENKPLFVFLEGPSGSGKQQLLERLSNIGYKTISTTFFKNALSNNDDHGKSFDENLKTNITLENNKQHKDEQLKNGLIFVHRSPISSIIYNGGNNSGIENKIESIDKLIKNETNQYNSVYIYCKTPVELIQQRLGGRYHFYEDNENELVGKLLIVENQEPSYETYDQLQQNNTVFNQTLDTTSIKQACPSLLALFNIYFNVSNSFKFPPSPQQPKK